jgi:hypothetical protein
LADAFDAVADLRAAVRSDRVFDGAFVVINEQARRREIGQLLLQPVELDGAGDGIGGATAELALVINRRALRRAGPRLAGNAPATSTGAA